MKSFLYRLEPVLKSRANEEVKAILAQSAAQKEYAEQLGELEKLKNDLENMFEKECSLITTQEYLTRWVYMDFLKNSAERQEDAVEKARRELERKRKALIKARKDKLVLQKHKDRLYESYIAELNRWEAKINDDQCTALAHRRKGE
ncbi:MAG: hypothetical protein JL50_16510 [Peptococcaceae bacterium BICA1-7]|nr:MAG: hypothetical protein JL50_16510 [Peptococcaceae bacterium BICA1-7]